MTPLYPSLYEVNTRVRLGEAEARATLDDLPDAFLDEVARLGFDILWTLGVWQTGPAGQHVARSLPELRREYRRVLPDFREEDVPGSPFAVQSYTVHADFGGDAALARLRERLRQRGVRLLLDLVPNHTALDHPWVQEHPEYYVRGGEADLAGAPHNWCRLPTGRGPAVLAHGRDPYFPGWTDTLQINYRHAGARAAMVAELERIAERCDGVRCDMAMLLLPDVFRRTWGESARPADGTAAVDEPFWPQAIAAVRRRHPEFVFIAEAYWGLEWVLLQQGFDYAYDKRLYDRLRAGQAGPVRDHLKADLDFQRRCVRFLENHDEPRAAASFPPEMHRAAAVLTYLVPGLRFFHEGQLEGRRARVPVQLGRRPAEPVDEALREFYGRLLDCLKRPAVRDGRWRPCACRAAWDGNPTWERFLAFTWEGGPGRRLLVAVNYGPTQGQCYVEPVLPDLRGRDFLLRDLLGPAEYRRGGDELAARGLYLDVPAWGHHVFDVRDAAASP